MYLQETNLNSRQSAKRGLDVLSILTPGSKLAISS